MSRAGYTDDDDDPLALGRWRAQVASAIRGRRGQAFLHELLEALDAMPVKRLIAHELIEDGEVCALGCIGAKRGLNLETIDPYDVDSIHQSFGIANAMAREIEWVNDEAGMYPETPEQRWARVRAWVAANIKQNQPEDKTNG